MKFKSLLAAGVGALALAGGPAVAQRPGIVVSVHYSVRENNVEKLQKLVTDSVERVVVKLERCTLIQTSTSHGTVDVEIGFQHEATRQDLAAVSAQLERLNFGENVAVISYSVELQAPRLSYDPVPAHP